MAEKRTLDVIAQNVSRCSASALTLTSLWLLKSTRRAARFEEATGVGLAPVSPTTPYLMSCAMC
jgi:hypothetical protein